MFGTKEDKLRAIDEEFYRTVHRVIADKVTPVYNMFILIFAAIFAYFIVIEQPQCFAKEGKPFGVQYSDTEDVTIQFYWLSLAGMSLLLLQSVMYYVQSREEMFDTMRLWVMLTNLMIFAWFCMIQYYRFKDSGRACSGDFLVPGSLGFVNPLEERPIEKEKILSSASHYLLVDQGFWFMLYVIMQYVLFILCKIV